MSMPRIEDLNTTPAFTSKTECQVPDVNIEPSGIDPDQESATQLSERDTAELSAELKAEVKEYFQLISKQGSILKKKTQCADNIKSLLEKLGITEEVERSCALYVGGNFDDYIFNIGPGGSKSTVEEWEPVYNIRKQVAL
ncbi:MAG: hypothetical protein AAF984_10340 [Verrucomicrobiota bacterium]